MYLLRLGLAGVGGERVGGEQIERQLAASGRPGGHAVEQLVAELRQVGRQAERRIVDGAAQPVPQRVRRGRPPRVEPGQDLVAGHRAKSRTISGVRARASPSLDASPTPADAKWGRPPPLPPVAWAIALAMSPAFTPLETRSSVTATWIPARSPFVNSTEIARLCFARKPSMIAAIWLRSSRSDSPTCSSTSPIFSTAPRSPLPAPFSSSLICFSSFLFSSSIASMRRAR